MPSVPLESCDPPSFNFVQRRTANNVPNVVMQSNQSEKVSEYNCNANTATVGRKQNTNKQKKTSSPLSAGAMPKFKENKGTTRSTKTEQSPAARQGKQKTRGLPDSRAIRLLPYAYYYYYYYSCPPTTDDVLDNIRSRCFHEPLFPHKSCPLKLALAWLDSKNMPQIHWQPCENLVKGSVSRLPSTSYSGNTKNSPYLERFTHRSRGG